MAKDKTVNPVAAQRKAEKAKAIKKGKATVQAQRDEKLARRNPARIEKQIQDLKGITENGGRLSSHEEAVLAGLEKELAAVNKARKALGDKAPVFETYSGAKRRRGDDDEGRRGPMRRWDEDSSDGEVPADIKRIPMPRDTPPPIEKKVLDAWYAKRRERRAKEEEARRKESGEVDKNGQKKEAAAPVVAKKVYEAKPVVRDLVKEAVKAFTPLAVLRKMGEGGRGAGGLLEPEEADELEAQGYLKTGGGQQIREVVAEKDSKVVEDMEVEAEIDDEEELRAQRRFEGGGEAEMDEEELAAQRRFEEGGGMDPEDMDEEELEAQRRFEEGGGMHPDDEEELEAQRRFEGGGLMEPEEADALEAQGYSHFGTLMEPEEADALEARGYSHLGTRLMEPEEADALEAQGYSHFGTLMEPEEADALEARGYSHLGTRLMEPEEADALEAQGYTQTDTGFTGPARGPRRVTMEEVQEEEDF